MAHVSSDGVAERQADGTYHADAEQVEDIERYAAQRGLRVEYLPPEADTSGGLPIEERPALLAAIEGVERGVYAGMVSAYLSRLTRSRSGIAVWDRVEAAGGSVHAARENINTSTPSGRLTRDIHLAIAVNEREEHAARFAARRKATCEAGVWRVRQLPRGYVFKGPPGEDGRYRGKARQLTPGPQAGEVQQAALDVIAGQPIAQIARRVGMTPSGTRAMLANRVYVGELRDGTTVNPTAHEPILTVDVFDAVQAALSGNPRPARSAADGPALLAGIAKCAGCGRALTRKSAKQLTYGCIVRHAQGDCTAPASIAAHLLDGYVETLARERYRTVMVRGDVAADVGAATAAVTAAKAARSALLRAILAAGIDKADAVDELREADAAVTGAEARLRDARARSLAPTAAPGDEADLSLDVTGRNAALRGLIRSVVVTRSGSGGRPDVAGRVRVFFHDD